MKLCVLMTKSAFAARILKRAKSLLDIGSRMQSNPFMKKTLRKSIDLSAENLSLSQTKKNGQILLVLHIFLLESSQRMLWKKKKNIINSCSKLIRRENRILKLIRSFVKLTQLHFSVNLHIETDLLTIKLSETILKMTKIKSMDLILSNTFLWKAPMAKTFVIELLRV